MSKTLRSVAICSAATIASLLLTGQSFAQIPSFPTKNPINKPIKKPVVPLTNQSPVSTSTKTATLNGRLDGALISPSGMALFLVNDNYASYDIAGRKLGFTRAHDFQGVPQDVDAALMHPINRKGYFFKGDKYYRYNFFTKKTEITRTIGRDGWKGISGPIDAALAHPYNNHIYFFKGNKYQKFSLDTAKVTGSGTIGVDDWIGIPEDIDGAFLHSNGKAYFFKSDTYHRFDFAKNRRDVKRVTGKDGWRNVSFAKDNRATENTNANAHEEVTLRITLESIRMGAVGDSDEIADIAIASSVSYSALGKNKTFVNREINRLKQPEIIVTGDSQKDNKWHSILTGNGRSDIEARTMDDKYTQIEQLHIRKNETKVINNYIDFKISADEAADLRASIHLPSSIQEVDNCNSSRGTCDAVKLEPTRPDYVNIYEVLKYLKNPNGVAKDYFSDSSRTTNSPNDIYYTDASGEYHDYGPSFLKLKKGNNGGLVGGITYSHYENRERDSMIISYKFQLIE